jgi:hypothetical protein
MIGHINFSAEGKKNYIPEHEFTCNTFKSKLLFKPPNLAKIEEILKTKNISERLKIIKNIINNDNHNKEIKNNTKDGSIIENNTIINI